MSKRKDVVELLEFLDNSQIEDILENITEYAMEETDRYLIPETKENHIGIEFECYSKFNLARIVSSLKKYGLWKYSSVGSDSSIDCSYDEFDYEIRFLFPEDRFHLLLRKFEKVIKDCKIKTNESCGLHVHLDMRNRERTVVLKNLFKCIPIMKKLTKKSRHDNHYCEIESDWTYQTSNTINDYGWHSGPNKYRAINAYNAYNRHRTYEVRLHEGTTDITKVIKWCKFLVSVASHKTQIKSVKQVPKKVKLLHGVKTYLKDAV